MCLSLNQSVALMPSCIDVTILCRNNINQYSLYASKLSAGTIFIKGQYSSQYMAQKRNRSICHFKLTKYQHTYYSSRYSIYYSILSFYVIFSLLSHVPKHYHSAPNVSYQSFMIICICRVFICKIYTQKCSHFLLNSYRNRKFLSGKHKN